MFARLSRRRPSASLVLSLTALLVSLSGWGYAATGGGFTLGRPNNAGRPTRLTSGARHGPTLALKNTGGQAAASFSVKSGVAPFSVGSTARVGNLNADMLDGVDSAGFYATGSKVADADRLDGVDSTGFYKAGSKVADADKLDGLDGAALQKRIMKTCAAGSAIRIVNADGSVVCELAPAFVCPAGTTLSTGVCFDNTSRAPADHGTAENDCADEGRRLPSGGELTTFAKRAGITLSSPAEWTDDLGDVTYKPSFVYFVIADPGNAVQEAFKPLPYRCVTGPGLG